MRGVENPNCAARGREPQEQCRRNNERDADAENGMGAAGAVVADESDRAVTRIFIGYGTSSYVRGRSITCLLMSIDCTIRAETWKCSAARSMSSVSIRYR